VGENFDYGKKGEFLTLDQFHSWIISLCACRCFGSDRAPGVAPRGAFWSRTVLPTVARWFAIDARETVDSFVQVRAALRCVTPYVLA
jgi:hypothetical protein